MATRGDFPDDITVSNLPALAFLISPRTFKYFFIPFALISTSIILSISPVNCFIPLALPSSARVILQFG